MSKLLYVKWTADPMSPGCKCKVVESLGYNHDIGMYAKIVQFGTEEKTAVAYKRSGPWRFWNLEDRINPLLEGLAARLREERDAKLFSSEPGCE